jgi:hypothetical protein
MGHPAGRSEVDVSRWQKAFTTEDTGGHGGQISEVLFFFGIDKGLGERPPSASLGRLYEALFLSLCFTRGLSPGLHCFALCG